jgi:hypothetical protein
MRSDRLRVLLRPSARVAALTGSLLVLTAVAAACGSSTSASGATAASAPATVAGAGAAAADGSTPADTAGGGGGQRGAALQAYRDCMAANGVTLPQFGGRSNRTGSTVPGASTPFGNGGDGGPDGGPAPDGSFPGGSFPGGSFPGGSFPGGSFPQGSVPGGGFRPGSSTPPDGVDAAVYAKALEACKDKLPAFGNGTGGGGRGRLNNPAYVACMKDNGVILPVPATTVAGATTVPGATAAPVSTIDRTSATYQAADAKCRVLLPNGGAPGSSVPAASTSVGG